MVKFVFPILEQVKCVLVSFLRTTFEATDLPENSNSREKSMVLFDVKSFSEKKDVTQMIQ